MKFEDSLKNLEKSIAELEKPDLTLSRGVAVFEEGIKHAKLCMESLNECKGKIKLLKQELDGIIETDFGGEDYE